MCGFETRQKISKSLVMDSHASISFYDVTNTATAKRRAAPHHTQTTNESSTVTLAMFEDLSSKVDLVFQKVDAIYELLRDIHQKTAAPAASLSVPRVGIDAPSPRASAGNISTNNTAPFVPAAAARADLPVVLFDEPQPQPQQPEQQPQSQPQPQQPPPPVMIFDEKSLLSRGGSSTLSGDGGWMRRDCFVLLVEFKCRRVKRCEADRFVAPGQYAIVQGDRGHDCGVVNQCSEWRAESACFVREESFDGNIVNLARMKNELGRVVRVASEEEVERLFGEIARNENLALKTCREIVARLGLDMEVVDCEYQFDQQKISFYYEASRSIDFRQLNNELYRIFGVRIWLQNVNNAVKNVVPVGAMSRVDKTQYKKSGLRPPAAK